MGAIVAIPALLALCRALKYSPARAFLDVYLPVLLLFPEYYRWHLPAVPDPTFSQAAILPIAAVFLPSAIRHWKVSLMDWLMLSFAVVVSCSEYQNTGFREAQDLMFDMLASVLLPYALAKGLIENGAYRVAFARRFAILIFGVSVFSVFEFRLGRDPWQILMNPLFPGQGNEWIVTFRYGFARIGGPYGHAILAGLIVVVGYRLQRWLEWGGHWEPGFRALPWLKIPKSRLITLGILAGIAMTLVRGPWIGGAAGAVLALVGRAKNRRRAFLVVAAGLILIGIPVATWFISYASVGRAHAKTDSQETAAYRKELLDKYVDIAKERGALGWGRNTWPKVPGMPSIDNYYLLLALMHGFVADGILVAMILSTIFRLIRFEMKFQHGAAARNSLGFTLAAIHLGIAVTIATVYMGLTVVPVFAMLTGWAEGYLVTPRRAEVTGILPASEVVREMATRKFAFRRVVA